MHDFMKSAAQGVKQEKPWFLGPPQNQRFFSTGVSWLLDTRKDSMKNKIVTNIFLFAKGGRTTTSGGQGAPFFSGNTTGSWF